MRLEDMKGLFRDISETVQRILDYPVLPKSGITIASLLLLGTVHGMEIVINVALTLAVLAPFATIAFVRAGWVLVRDEADADGGPT